MRHPGKKQAPGGGGLLSDDFGRAKVRTANDGDDSDSAARGRKCYCTTVARAALLGIEVHELPGSAWLLRHAHGADIGLVRGLSALVAAVAGFEAAHRDVRELVQRMRRPA